MKKVVAFLEKYAEWLATGVACLFLLYMVYAYVVSPDDLRVQVGQQTLMPGEVDPNINANLLLPLEKQINDPKAEGVSFPVPDFVKSFSLAMSKERERMDPKYAIAGAFRPGVAPEGPEIREPGNTGPKVAALPVAIPPVFTAFNRGASLVKIPPPGGAAAAVAAGPAAAAPGVEMDKTWIMWEGRIDIKAQAAAWKKALFDAKGEPIVPTSVLLTHFLRVEVEREEEIDPGTWSAPVSIPPLALAEIKDYPKVGERNAEEEYRLWSEKHQVDLVEPPFYQIVKGDEWFIPSLRAKEAVAAAANQVVAEGPFDPANPPKNRELTPEEKQKVYLYNQKQAAEKEKQEAAARKSKAESTRPPAPAGGSGSGSGRGRKMGGYAPLPGEGRIPGQRYDDGGRPIGPTGRPGRQGYDRGARDGMGRPLPGREGPRFNPNQNFNNGPLQNGVPTDSFDPTLRVDPQGVANDIIMWVHDDTVVPGKVYRYRVKVSLKNPIYNTQGLTTNKAFETQLAITSDWSAWSPEIQAPPSTEFFFSRAVPQINGKGVINTVMVDVFKHEKGDWTEATFNVGPGDSIGRLKDNMDYNTGMTIVDIRGDLREKDTKIMVADEKGSLKVISFQSQLADKRYADLKEKVKAAAASGPAAAAGTPSLINR